MPTDGEDAFREVYDREGVIPGDNSSHPGFANDDTRPTYVIAAPGSGTARPSLGLGGGSRLTGLLVLAPGARAEKRDLLWTLWSMDDSTLKSVAQPGQPNREQIVDLGAETGRCNGDLYLRDPTCTMGGVHK